MNHGSDCDCKTLHQSEGPAQSSPVQPVINNKKLFIPRPSLADVGDVGDAGGAGDDNYSATSGTN